MVTLRCSDALSHCVVKCSQTYVGPLDRQTPLAGIVKVLRCNGVAKLTRSPARLRTSTPEQPVPLVVQAGNPALEQRGRSLTMDPPTSKDVVRRATSGEGCQSRGYNSEAPASSRAS